MAATRSRLLHFKSTLIFSNQRPETKIVAVLHLIFLGSFSQFVLLLYLLTYVGALTNGLTLLITGELFYHTECFSYTNIPLF